MSNFSQKRITFEESKLHGYCKNSTSLTTFEREGDCFIIQFKGPQHTEYSNQLFKVKCHFGDRYPFNPPQIFWIGEAPTHRFYSKESDSVERLSGVTNLANTDFGIYYQWHSPSRTIIDCIERIQYSLTPVGEKEMQDFMKSYV